MRCSVVWVRDCLARPAAGAAAAASKLFAGAQGMHYSACCACLHNCANQQRAAHAPALIDAAFARAANASVQIYTKRTQERKKEKTSQKNIEKRCHDTSAKSRSTVRTRSCRLCACTVASISSVLRTRLLASAPHSLQPTPPACTRTPTHQSIQLQYDQTKHAPAAAGCALAR